MFVRIYLYLVEERDAPRLVMVALQHQLADGAERDLKKTSIDIIR